MPTILELARGVTAARSLLSFEQRCVRRAEFASYGLKRKRRGELMATLEFNFRWNCDIYGCQRTAMKGWSGRSDSNLCSLNSENLKQEQPGRWKNRYFTSDTRVFSTFIYIIASLCIMQNISHSRSHCTFGQLSHDLNISH